MHGGTQHAALVSLHLSYFRLNFPSSLHPGQPRQWV